jgi:hypothetical protein
MSTYLHTSIKQARHYSIAESGALLQYRECCTCALKSDHVCAAYARKYVDETKRTIVWLTVKITYRWRVTSLSPGATVTALALVVVVAVAVVLP